MIQALLEQVAHAAPGEGAQVYGTFGSGFQACIAIAPGQREQAEAGAVAHLRVRLVGQLVIDQLARVGADPRAPVEQALWRPFAMRLVRRGHVLALGTVSAASPQQQVAGHPPVAMQHFQGVCRQSHVHVLPGQGGGHAVEAAIDLDVVVDADLAALEGGDLVGMHRQRSQGRAIQALEPVAPAAIEPLERAPIQILQQLGDGLVKRMQAEELPMAQPRHDPALDHLHRHLGLGLGLRGRAGSITVW